MQVRSCEIVVNAAMLFFVFSYNTRLSGGSFFDTIPEKSIWILKTIVQNRHRSQSLIQ